MNLRRACEHGRYDSHYWQSPDTRLWELKGGLCPGGTEPTTDELLAMLVEDYSQDHTFGERVRILAAARAFLAAITEEGE